MIQLIFFFPVFVFINTCFIQRDDIITVQSDFFLFLTISWQKQFDEFFCATYFVGADRIESTKHPQQKSPTIKMDSVKKATLAQISVFVMVFHSAAYGYMYTWIAIEFLLNMDICRNAPYLFLQ